MKEIKRIRISEPVRIGDIIIEDFLRLGVDLIATRESR